MCRNILSFCLNRCAQRHQCQSCLGNRNNSRLLPHQPPRALDCFDSPRLYWFGRMVLWKRGTRMARTLNTLLAFYGFGTPSPILHRANVTQEPPSHPARVTIRLHLRLCVRSAEWRLCGVLALWVCRHHPAYANAKCAVLYARFKTRLMSQHILVRAQRTHVSYTTKSGNFVATYDVLIGNTESNQ